MREKPGKIKTATERPGGKNKRTNKRKQITKCRYNTHTKKGWGALNHSNAKFVLVGKCQNFPKRRMFDSELLLSLIWRNWNRCIRHTQTHTDTYRHTQTYTDTHRHTQTHTDTHRHTQTHHRHTQTHTDAHRHTQTHAHEPHATSWSAVDDKVDSQLFPVRLAIGGFRTEFFQLHMM